MTKGGKNIEKDLYKLVAASSLATLVSGKVYRKDMRPEGSDKEDIVVKFLSGAEGQIQTGVIVLNVYVPDISSKAAKRLVENSARVEVLEKAVIAFVQECKDTEYLYELDETPYSIAVEGINQHVIYTRIHYQRITV